MSINNFHYIAANDTFDISRSFELSINVLLRFDMHEVNGALFFNRISLSSLSFLLAVGRSKEQYRHHYGNTNLILAF